MMKKYIALPLLISALATPATAQTYQCEIDGKTKSVGMSCDQYSKLFPPKKVEQKKTADEVWKAKRDARQAAADRLKLANEKEAELASRVRLMEAQAGPSMNRTAEAHCRKAWSKRGVLDSDMYSYCIKNQESGYEDIRRYKLIYSGETYFKKFSLPLCENRWIKRGITDAEMLAHCLKSEVEGAKDFIYYRDKYGADAVSIVGEQALRRYGSMEMVAYEVKNHFEP